MIYPLPRPLPQGDGLYPAPYDPLQLPVSAKRPRQRDCPTGLEPRAALWSTKTRIRRCQTPTQGPTRRGSLRPPVGSIPEFALFEAFCLEPSCIIATREVSGTFRRVNRRSSSKPTSARATPTQQGYEAIRRQQGIRTPTPTVVYGERTARIPGGPFGSTSSVGRWPRPGRTFSTSAVRARSSIFGG